MFVPFLNITEGQRVKPAGCFGGGTSSCPIWICGSETVVAVAAAPHVCPACIPIRLLLTTLDVPSIHDSFLGTIFLLTRPRLRALTQGSQSESSIFLVVVIDSGKSNQGPGEVASGSRKGYTENNQEHGCHFAWHNRAE